MKRLKEELEKERERLEYIILKENISDYFKCDKCKLIQHKKGRRHCGGKQCVEPDVCFKCIDHTADWDVCDYCQIRCCTNCKDIDIRPCEVPGCKIRFCACRKFIGCTTHKICGKHPKSYYDNCFVCNIEKNNNAKSAITTMLGIIRRKKMCSKDVYINLLVPLFKTIRHQAVNEECWLSRVQILFKKK